MQRQRSSMQEVWSAHAALNICCFFQLDFQDLYNKHVNIVFTGSTLAPSTQIVDLWAVTAGHMGSRTKWPSQTHTADCCCVAEGLGAVLYDRNYTYLAAQAALMQGLRAPGHCHVLNVNIETSAFQNEDRDKFKRSCKDMEHQASAAQHDLEDLQKAQMSDT